jgi:hypothetical protein
LNRIFLTLAVVINAALAAAAWYGLSIGSGQDLETDRHAMSMHLLVALAASILTLMLHAVALTYFMGTGRWIEETSAAYRLNEDLRRQNIRLKYRVIPGMVGCMALVIITGAAGALSDPLSATRSVASTIHFTLAITLLAANVLVSWLEYVAIKRNGALVAQAVAEVRRIRTERGLEKPVPDAAREKHAASAS